ncbi:oligosaccharide flippase family protein [Microbacterium yannicii]|uniref:Oligosaccharide flippase family protein n=1 Tax=Microbacterium yannicii TaxID=671622 RepID=A0ABP9LQL6_9MICO|nr:lipopolysaccharide biosynthesis protein [Microbacterium yannicii]MCO5952325.1 lipopolysaccharide biosynthesis protein [Microbacterium yannicii]
MSDQGQEQLGSRAAGSVAWLTAQTWIVKAGGFVTVIILARLLTPQDFGLVAVAMTIVPLVYLLAELGFGTYLVQAKVAGRRAIGTAFWYAVGAGVILTAALILCAPWLEDLFGVPGVAGVIVGISPAVMFVSLAAVPVALMRREMRFRALAIQSAVAAVLAQIVAILLALSGAGVWALVAQVGVSQAVTWIAAWISTRWRPPAVFDWQEFRTMFSFGAKVVGINGIATVRQWAESLIITNVLGANALGQLAIAQRLILTSQEIAGAAIAPVSTVVFAQVRDDPERLKRGYDRALALAYYVITPAMTAILVTAPVLVPLLFGDQWTASVVPTQWLAVAALFTMAAALDHGFFYGLGRPGLWLVYGLAVDALTVLVTFLTAAYGLNAITAGFAGVAALAAVVRWVMISRMLSTSLWTVARRGLAAVVLMAVTGGLGWLAFTLTGSWPGLLQIVLASVVVLAAHMALARLLLARGSQDFFAEVRRRLRPRARS